MATAGLVVTMLMVMGQHITARSSLGHLGNLSDYQNRIGVTHVAGAYNFTEKPYLTEGADQILALGSKVIKLHMNVPTARNYPFNSHWPKIKTLVDLASAVYYQEVFQKPFSTYILTTYSVGRPDNYWIRDITEEQARDERKQFYLLTKYLLNAYRESGKTFVLQHWEGDWAIRGNYDVNVEPSSKSIDGMIRWLNARQDGVDQARKEMGNVGVRVLHAAEVNLVNIAIRDRRPTVTNSVLPHTRVDLVSYSAWDTQHDPALLRSALDYIADHVPDREPFGERNVFLGEFGLPANEYPASQVKQTILDVLQVAKSWGSPYAIYWQLYCNEPLRLPVASNKDVRGFWLVRPDGTRTAAWRILHHLLTPQKRAALYQG